MEKVKDKLKDKYGKVNKKALLAAIGVMLMSWAALPIVYYLIVRKKGRGEEVENVLGESGHKDKEGGKEDGNME